jgi:hypothetical protein
MTNLKEFGSKIDLKEVLSRYLSDEAKENKKNSVNITKLPTEIRTDHFPNIVIQPNYYDNPLKSRVGQDICSPLG